MRDTLDDDSVTTNITTDTFGSISKSPNTKLLLPTLSAPPPSLKFKTKEISKMAIMIAGKKDKEIQRKLNETLRISTPSINDRKNKK
jgi:hypothetical protein